MPRPVGDEGDLLGVAMPVAARTYPVKRAALYIKCNDLLWKDTVFIPVMHRLKVEAAANALRPALSGWANETDNIQDWYREA